MDILQKTLDELLARNLDAGPEGPASASPEGQVRVLAIAPYPAMADVFYEVALDYPQIDLTVQVGDRESGLAAALTVFEANYDVVISRGGTARVLEEEVTIPVVEVEVSALDVMRQIASAEVGEGRVAAVGFESILQNIIRGRDVMPPNLDIFTLEFADEAPLVMGKIADGGYALVLCDNVSLLEAQRLGLPAQLLESGDDSVRQAFEQAIFHCRYWNLERDRSRLLWDLARNQTGRLVIYLQGGGLIFSNLTEHDVEVYGFLERHLNDTHSRRLVFRHLGTVYRIKPVHMGMSDTNVAAFSISVHEASVQAGLAGIEYLNLDEVGEQVDESFFVKTHALTMLSGNVDDALRLGRPIMLCGEVGSGKKQIARLLYLASDRADRPFVEIDCDLLNKKSARFVTQSYNSPLYATNQTIYLHDVQNLAEDVRREILAIAVESHLTKRCMLILSGDLNPDGSEPEGVSIFTEQLKCVTVDIPALRTMPEVIRGDALAYLASLAEAAGRDLPEVEPEALDLLEQSPWPRNNFQLQKVLDRLFVGSADTGRISAEDAARAISREDVRNDVGARGSVGGLDVLRPLADIEREIAAEALRRCDGNRSEAARHLGISRTTLWRMLKEQ